MSRSRTLFLVATGLVALHVADDSFLQPQPGTSAADHLVSGLVPLAGLGAAVWITARSGDGARAAIDLLVGIFGVVAGLEAVHYAREVGPTGDDFTGLLAIPAGLTLIGLGLVTLWSTRNRDGGPARLVLRRAGIAVAAFVVFQFVVFPVAVAYVVTHAARPPVERIDLGGRDTDVRFRTSDGLRLHGSYVPSRNGAAVIVAFGRKGSQPHARMLARHGYGVLIFDRRGEGHSDGDPNAYGWSDGELDLRAAVDFLQRRPDVDPGRIGGLGLSVGGETFLQAAAHDRRIRAVASEGASARSVGELRSVPGSDALTAATMAGITAGTAIFSNATPPPHLRDLVGRIAPRPMFLIYATKGTGGEEHTFNRAFYREAGRGRAIWEIPESGHVGGLEARPREYEQRVAGFFDRAIGKGRE